jgi:hypothetical protein
MSQRKTDDPRDLHYRIRGEVLDSFDEELAGRTGSHLGVKP